MKPTQLELLRAVKRMSIRLKFFEKDPDFQMEVFNLLESMVGTSEQLEKFISNLVNRCNEWPGFLELRGAFCFSYKPADGISAECTIPGFTAADGERTFQKRLALESGQKQLPPPDVEPEELAESEEARVRVYRLILDGVKSVPKPPVVNMKVRRMP